MLNSMKNATHALRDHLWTAWDVGHQASWYGTPNLVDLLAGGRRQGFNESPDSFYSLGFINIQPDSKWYLKIPDVGAFYTVVSLHSKDKQKSVEWLNNNPVASECGIEFSQDVSAGGGIQTNGFNGLCQIMVRQYFTFPVDTGELPFPELVQGHHSGKHKRKYLIPGGVVAGIRFLTWRLRPLFAIKYLQHRLGTRLPRNVFLSFEDIVQLWKGGADMVTRMGVEKFRYLFCYYDIKPQQSMKIQYDANGSHYFAFALNHMWVQRLKHESLTTHANSHQLDAVDGGYEITVTHEKTNQANSLYTLGNQTGIIGFREILPGQKPTIPVCSIITH